MNLYILSFPYIIPTPSFTPMSSDYPPLPSTTAVISQREISQLQQTLLPDLIDLIRGYINFKQDLNLEYRWRTRLLPNSGYWIDACPFNYRHVNGLVEDDVHICNFIKKVPVSKIPKNY
jgi:hypothetical protein